MLPFQADRVMRGFVDVFRWKHASPLAMLLQDLGLLRAYSHRFLLWKSFDIDIISAAQLFLSTIALANMPDAHPAKGTADDADSATNPKVQARAPSKADLKTIKTAKLLGVYRTTGKYNMILPNGKPLPPVPQPGLLPPPEAAEGPMVYGSQVALLAWLVQLGGAGEGSAKSDYGSKAVLRSVGAGALGGVHSYVGYPTSISLDGGRRVKGEAPDGAEHVTSTIVLPASNAAALGGGAEGGMGERGKRGWVAAGWWAGAHDVFKSSTPWETVRIKCASHPQSLLTFPPHSTLALRTYAMIA